QLRSTLPEHTTSSISGPEERGAGAGGEEPEEGAEKAGEPGEPGEGGGSEQVEHPGQSPKEAEQVGQALIPEDEKFLPVNPERTIQIYNVGEEKRKDSPGRQRVLVDISFPVLFPPPPTVTTGDKG